jgi:hypothetical protein
MYSGHGSWISLVVFGAGFLARSLFGQRRRGGYRPPGSGRSFTGQGPRDVGRPAGGTAFTGTAAGWFHDPFVRHEQRYWSGTEWTDHVTDAGVPSVDPPPTPRRRPEPGH